MKLVLLSIEKHKKTVKLREVFRENQSELIRVSNSKNNRMLIVMTVNMYKSVELLVDDHAKFVTGRVFFVETDKIDELALKKLGRGDDSDEVAMWVVKKVRDIDMSDYEPLCNQFSAKDPDGWLEFKRCVYHVNRVVHED